VVWPLVFLSFLLSPGGLRLVLNEDGSAFIPYECSTGSARGSCRATPTVSSTQKKKKKKKEKREETAIVLSVSVPKNREGCSPP